VPQNNAPIAWPPVGCATPGSEEFRGPLKMARVLHFQFSRLAHSAGPSYLAGGIWVHCKVRDLSPPLARCASELRGPWNVALAAFAVDLVQGERSSIICSTLEDACPKAAGNVIPDVPP